MLFFIFNWLGVILLGIGAVLFVTRPLFALKAKKGPPLTARRKMWLWFFQVMGFWAIFIGAWMVTEGFIKSKMVQAAEAAEEAAEERAEREQKKKENKKNKKRKNKRKAAAAADAKKAKKEARRAKAESEETDSDDAEDD